MRSEIKRLHQEIGTTMIYVTHDQIEAMTLADRIVLLKDGLIEQAGSPLDLFERPATRFVAGFLGSPQMNFVPAKAAAGAIVFADGGRVAWPAGRSEGLAEGREVVLGIRPEHIHRIQGALRDGHERCGATVELIQPTGSRTYVTVQMGGQPVVVEVGPHEVQRPGEALDLQLDLRRAILIDPASGRVLA
jgi:multiple sugar transport system ATP-binding protein